jgi:hypothetical protein
VGKGKQPTKSQLSLKPGDVVEVTLDDGTRAIDSVRTEPEKMGGHTWVVWLEQRRNYMLTRCRKIDVRPAI